jgi:broad specificity phosphatase PhoE
MQTADIIASGRDVPVQPTAELRERSFGQWEGFTYMEIQDSDPEGYDEWRRGGAQFTPPGGERVSDVQERVLRLTSRLMDTHPGDDTVLLLGHGGSLRDLAVCVLGLPLESRQRLALANASLSVIDVKSGSATLHLWNDVSHWQGKVPSDDP